MRLAGNGLIVKDKKILLLKRNFHTKAFPGYWTVPGGRQEKGETAEQTAIREVKEESNLDFVPTQLFHTNFTVNSGENIHSHRYLGEFSGEIKIQEKEATDYGWFTYEETLTLEIAFDYADVFKKLREEKYL